MKEIELNHLKDGLKMLVTHIEDCPSIGDALRDDVLRVITAIEDKVVTDDDEQESPIKYQASKEVEVNYSIGRFHADSLRKIAIEQSNSGYKWDLDHAASWIEGLIRKVTASS